MNGILVPGGAQDLRPGQPFFDTVSQLVDLTLAANDAGEHFPVSQAALPRSERGARAGAAARGWHLYTMPCRCQTPCRPPPAHPPPSTPRTHAHQMYGVCLGMEALAVAISRNHSILSDFDAENLPSPLFLTGGW